MEQKVSLNCCHDFSLTPHLENMNPSIFYSPTGVGVLPVPALTSPGLFCGAYESPKLNRPAKHYPSVTFIYLDQWMRAEGNVAGSRSAVRGWPCSAPRLIQVWVHWSTHIPHKHKHTHAHGCSILPLTFGKTNHLDGETRQESYNILKLTGEIGYSTP